MNQYSAAAAQTQRPGINISVMAAPCWQTCETATSSALIIVKQRAKKNEGQLSTASTTRSAWFGSLGSKRPKAKQPMGQTIPYTQTGNGMLRAKIRFQPLEEKILLSSEWDGNFTGYHLYYHTHCAAGVLVDPTRQYGSWFPRYPQNVAYVSAVRRRPPVHRMCRPSRDRDRNTDTQRSRGTLTAS